MKVPPLLQGFVAALLMSLISTVDRQDSELLKVVGVGLALAGMTIAILGVWQFRQHTTTVNPLSPEKASQLVTSGVYKLTRNPMYVGMVIVLIAWALWLGSTYSLAVVPLFMLSMTYLQIKPEENALTNLFGDEYIEYSYKVRRWL